VASAVLLSLTHVGIAQSNNRQDAAAVPGEQEAIHQRLASYLETFNKQDAVAVAKFWSADCLSIAEDSGERLEGREALQKQFAAFFQEAPGARLAGQITDIQIVRPDVAVIEVGRRSSSRTRSRLCPFLRQRSSRMGMSG